MPFEYRGCLTHQLHQMGVLEGHAEVVADVLTNQGDRGFLEKESEHVDRDGGLDEGDGVLVEVVAFRGSDHASHPATPKADLGCGRLCKKGPSKMDRACFVRGVSRYKIE